ncbi:helix-turn-helix domain-containing protein [Oxalobacteraceae bacterium A2-2]
MSLPSTELHLRSYDHVPTPGWHRYAQLVLPLQGQLAMDIGGRYGKVSPLQAAFVRPETDHIQHADGVNRSLIVDFDFDAVPPDTAQRLLEQPYPAIGAAAGKLVEFISLMREQGGAGTGTLANWLPLLLETLAGRPAQPVSRLSALLAHVEMHLASPWSAEAMAKHGNLSVSRLHALFREQLDTTPQAWLTSVRLQWVCRRLRETRLPIAQLALQAGFADQSALTHAMRRTMDTTPAAYRRGLA